MMKGAFVLRTAVTLTVLLAATGAASAQSPQPTMRLSVLAPPDEASGQGNTTTGLFTIGVMVMNVVCPQAGSVPIDLSLPASDVPQGLAVNVSPSHLQFPVPAGVYGNDQTPQVSHYMETVKANVTVTITNATLALATERNISAMMTSSSSSGMAGMNMGATASSHNTTVNDVSIPLVAQFKGGLPAGCQASGQIPPTTAMGMQNLTIAATAIKAAPKVAAAKTPGPDATETVGTLAIAASLVALARRRGAS
ncbi:MAG: hypothetical protein ACYDDF_08170 [Thermoplasmatota archaeon]